jgi:cell division protein ZapE
VVLDDNYKGKPAQATVTSLCLINPNISATELLAGLVPPPEFKFASFDSYQPDPAFPSQAEALAAVRTFTTGAKIGLFTKRVLHPGIYLDGGFGVGKTHLLAASYHAWRGAKAFGSFLEYTTLVGFLGFAAAVHELSQKSLICIDEFELDDPGDTMIMSRLLKELEAKGVRFAATSNTPPNALGDGRFAAADFKREIQGLGSRFNIITVDGEDYRHRPIEAHSQNLNSTEILTWATSQHQPAVDDFSELLQHLGQIHQTKYRKLISDVGALGITDMYQLSNQLDALRFVSFIDRLYEQQVPLRTSGSVAATEVFDSTMLAGGYRKKYLRAISRIGSLTLL